MGGNGSKVHVTNGTWRAHVYDGNSGVMAWLDRALCLIGWTAWSIDEQYKIVERQLILRSVSLSM